MCEFASRISDLSPLNTYLRSGSFEVVPLPYGPLENTPPTRFVPTPGVYAISMNLVTGVVLPPRWNDYLASFRQCQPIGRASWSIYIYRITR